MPRYVLPQYLLVGVLAFFTPLLHVSAHILRPRDCSFTWRAISGDTCASMANAWSISEAQFISFNPGVDCAALVVGKEYCLEWQGTPPPLPSSQSPTSVPKPTSTTFKTSTTPAPTGPVAPSPTQEGLAKDCQNFHLVVSGDTCSKLVSQYGTFSLTQFYSWNPAVGNDCSGLWLGYYVCIGVTGTPTSPPPKSTPTSTKPPATTGPAVPSPTQPDVSPNCNKWHLVSNGDFCQKIADQYKINLVDFYKWNPFVKSDCANLWLGYYVCVGSV